jgi:hypothetical protein
VVDCVAPSVGWGMVVTYPPRKQELGVEQVLGVPISQGSLAQMQRYFKVCFGPIISAVAYLRATTRSALC